ncbi:hypothetical protein SCP_0508110 [Sparassis crispa]|uniref:Uncharacterized protein n=1 Tax=Sparassis crispa TaxID=139825 RepID=A0A401GNG0_9APHY|nr:hypothetical protein SCP_0508110 [Sparassis crispa]GBE83755.1 hypothetical protein SCP_0508110 [Sparassis crispa]
MFLHFSPLTTLAPRGSLLVDAIHQLRTSLRVLPIPASSFSSGHTIITDPDSQPGSSGSTPAVLLVVKIFLCGRDPRSPVHATVARSVRGLDGPLHNRQPLSIEPRVVLTLLPVISDCGPPSDFLSRELIYKFRDSRRRASAREATLILRGRLPSPAMRLHGPPCF